MKLSHFLYLFLLVLISGCAQDQASLSSDGSTTGQGGSLARFTIVGSFLYTLETNQLEWFKLENNGEPSHLGSLQLEDGKETIFPLGDLLFVGATDGLSIFKINGNGTPELQGQVQHFLSCDPVVANDTYAFVTLRQEACNGLFNSGGDRNVLNVYDVTDITNPNIIASYDLTAPRGLGLAGDYLFVCEGEEGLRTLDVSDPLNLQHLSYKKDIHANDVIVLEDLLLVIGPGNITQFDYSDPFNLVKLSEILIE